MRSIRSTSQILVILVIGALAATACGSTGRPDPSVRESGGAGVGSAAPAHTTGASPSSRIPEALLAVGRAGRTELDVVDSDGNPVGMTFPLGLPDTDWDHVVTATPDGAETLIRNQALGEDTGQMLRIPGRWRLATVGEDPAPVGRSLDDSTIVLVEDRAGGYDGAASASRFAIVRPTAPPAGGELRLVRTIELAGAFEFDALSPNGSVLYLVQHLDSGPGGRYQVRSVPIVTGRLDDAPIADKRFVDEPMAGEPITQLRRSDGLVLTLYRGPEHPFVHALSTADGWAVCIDLPADPAADAVAAADWGLVQTEDGMSVYAVNATVGRVVEINPTDQTIRRLARLPASTAAAPIADLAKFGHADAGPVGRRAIISPDGRTLIAGGGGGVVAIDTGDLSVDWRVAGDGAVRSLALTRDGSALFALFESGRISAFVPGDGSSLGELEGADYDRLVAITG